jgi:hypothetical protein
MQFFHHENGDLEFRRLQLVGKGVTEFDSQNMPLRSWVDYYETLYPFNGYKSIPADAVQLACPRYYHMELHNILTDTKRPPKDGSFINKFISNWADSRGLDLAKAKKPKSAWDKVIIFLGLGLIIECVLWGILIYVTH